MRRVETDVSDKNHGEMHDRWAMDMHGEFRRVGG